MHTPRINSVLSAFSRLGETQLTDLDKRILRELLAAFASRIYRLAEDATLLALDRNQDHVIDLADFQALLDELKGNLDRKQPAKPSRPSYGPVASPGASGAGQEADTVL